MAWITNYYQASEQVKVHYSDVSTIQMFAIQIPTVCANRLLIFHFFCFSVSEQLPLSISLRKKPSDTNRTKSWKKDGSDFKLTSGNNIINHCFSVYFVCRIQCGSEIRPFWRLDFKWLGFRYGYSPSHLKAGPFEIRTFSSWFQMVFDKMADICPDFKWLGFLISDPIQNLDHLQYCLEY